MAKRANAFRRIRRVNLYAGPCHGKSTVYSQVLGKLKSLGEPVQGVHEVAQFYVLDLRLQGIQEVNEDVQMAIFKEQYQQEWVRLEAEPGTYLLMESNPFISILHAVFNGQESILPQMWNSQKRLDALYPALHIFLEPSYDLGTCYTNNGRYQDASTARNMHEFGRSYLTAHYGAENVYTFGTNEVAKMARFIKRTCNP